MRRQAQYGITLLELMIVVAVVGILSSVAYVMYDKSTKKAESSEVVAMFAEFQRRQYEYHSENGTFLATGTDDSDFWPAAPSRNGTPVTLLPLPDEWNDLKFNNDKTEVKCAYVTIAGDGGDDSNIGSTAASFGVTTAPNKDWFYIIAECDFDLNSAIDSQYFKASWEDKAYHVKNQGK